MAPKKINNEKDFWRWTIDVWRYSRKKSRGPDEVQKTFAHLKPESFAHHVALPMKKFMRSYRGAYLKSFIVPLFYTQPVCPACHLPGEIFCDFFSGTG